MVRAHYAYVTVVDNEFIFSHSLHTGGLLLSTYAPYTERYRIERAKWEISRSCWIGLEGDLLWLLHEEFYSKLYTLRNNLWHTHIKQ